MRKGIAHSGVVEQVVKGCVKVRILQTSACAACKVASHCNASESKEKIVDVYCDSYGDYQAGNNVIVRASYGVANRAMLLGFGLPLLLLLVVLLVTLQLTANEGIAALAALLALMPYYLGVWLFRDHIRNKLSFSIESI